MFLSIPSVPQWAVIEILSSLPPDVVWELRSVSRSLHCLASQDGLWRRMFQRKWKEEAVRGFRTGVMLTDVVSWRCAYASEFATFDSDSLYAVFCESGECSPPAPPSAIADLTAPSDLKAMLRRAQHWHICKDHVGVFGVNLFSETGPFRRKVDIFGDAEMEEEWAAEHASPNCAEAGWECFAVLSEFDFLFVCVAPGADFGATRRVTNNCFEDLPFTPAPFSCFLSLLVQFAEAYRVQHRRNPDEQLCLVHFARTITGSAQYARG
jgi:hypothetical protein